MSETGESLQRNDGMIVTGDAATVLSTIEEKSVQCCVTSPPYWGLRDYKHLDQIGLEATPDEYVDAIVDAFRGVRRVLHKEGIVWLNLGDSYAGSLGAQSRPATTDLNDVRSTLEGGSMLSARQIAAAPRGTKIGSLTRTPGLKNKDLVGIPWRVAFALQTDGWFLRADIIWEKPNAMPESVKDRPTRSHEYLFLLSKSAEYQYDPDPIREPHVDRRANKSGRTAMRGKRSIRPSGKSDTPERWYNELGRNARSVWTIATQSSGEDHFATFPEELVRRCVLTGTKPGDLVLDPFCGVGTTGLVALDLQRRFLGIELNEDYGERARERLRRAAWKTVSVEEVDPLS